MSRLLLGGPIALTLFTQSSLFAQALPIEPKDEPGAPAQDEAADPDKGDEGDAPEDDSAGAPSGEDIDRGTSAGAIEPPKPISVQPAQYPPSALASRAAATVVLQVTIERDGSTSDVVVVQSAGPDFDRAAREALDRWRFAPARQGGVPVSARISVPFHFDPPAPAPPAMTGGASKDGPGAEPVAGQRAGEQRADEIDVGVQATEEITVQGERPTRAETRSASDFHLERDVIAAAPRQEGAEVLRSAPGLYVGRGEGAAVAHSYMLRGFDAQHGQDIELRVGGLPINLPSHIHGQGYADLGFVISDTVWDVHITEGVYDPRQGDFAVAGSIDIHLGVGKDDRGVRLESGYGAFDTFRQTAIWAPQQADNESFGAAQYQRTDGFGEGRAGQRGSALFQHRFGNQDLSYRAIGILTAARSDLAGVLRKDDIDAGRVCFECVYPHATARQQSALSTRAIVGLFADYANPSGENGQVGLWLGRDDFRLQENFTGFTQRSRTLAGVAGRGDLIEQQNRTTSFGVTGRYRTAPMRPAERVHGTVEVGVDGRSDVIEQSQNLLDASVRNQTWDRRVDAEIRAVDLGMWGDLDWGFGGLVRARLGIRADVLSYDVDDRLGNFAPASRPDEAFIVGFRRSAFGVAWGPRASVELRPIHWMAWFAAYGEGYRSPQARTLTEGERAPFTKVRSVDTGPRFDFGDALRLSASGYYTHLSDDVAFDAEEGRLEPIGASRRMGAVLHAVTEPTQWLVGAGSVTYVDASLLEPPPPTAEEPQPPFEQGQRLPFVPPVVVRTDVGAHGRLVDDAAGQALEGRVGSGLSVLSSRPLPYGEAADPVFLLDASAALDWGPMDLTLEIFNLLDTQYAAVEYNFASNWDPDAPRTRTPARHVAAGAPLSWMLSLGVTL